MGIKITGLNVKKDKVTSTTHTQLASFSDVAMLDGEIMLELSEGVITGVGKIHVTGVSEKLQNKLYDVLNEIENELNGEETASHETESDEFQQLEDALESVGKLFGSAIFVGNKEYKNALKSKGFDLL